MRRVRTAYQREYARRLRASVIALMGGRCVKCGYSDSRALQIDHIHGGGNRERGTLWNTQMQRKILSSLEWEDEYQLLCANCNAIKRVENGEGAVV